MPLCHRIGCVWMCSMEDMDIAPADPQFHDLDQNIIRSCFRYRPSPLFPTNVPSKAMVCPRSMTRSMRPLIVQGRDLVTVKAADGPLKPLDVALYRRGKSYVLHRVIEVNDDGTYLIRGDNTYSDEIVPDSAVLGVLTEFVRDGKQYKVTDEEYLRYVRKRVKSYPMRRLYVLSKQRTKRAIKKIIGWDRAK